MMFCTPGTSCIRTFIPAISWSARAEQVKLIDFGVARIAGVEHEFRRAHRAGVAFFFEPEYAKHDAGEATAAVFSALGEQYALAALLYLLITGEYYLDFSFEKKEMLRQIAEDAPLDFTRARQRGLARSGAVARQGAEQAPGRTVCLDCRICGAAEGSSDRGCARSCRGDGEHGAGRLRRGGRNAADRCCRNSIPSAALFTAGLPAAPKVSVTFGAAGIAYALYRIACAQESAALLSLADLWGARAARDIEAEDAFYSTTIEITPEVVGRVSPYHTASGIHLVRGLIGRAMSDVVSQQAAVSEYVAAATAHGLRESRRHARAGRNHAGRVTTAGRGCGKQFRGHLRAGGVRQCNLHGALEADGRRRADAEIAADSVSRHRARVGRDPCMRRCAGASRQGWKLPPGTDGAARRPGGAGRTYRPPRALAMDHTQPSQRAGRRVYGGLVQRQRGFVHLWTLAHRMLGKPEYLALAEKAAMDAWECDGPLGNLCCGYAGQAYAMLNLYKHTGELAWLHRAQRLAQKAAEAQGAHERNGSSRAPAGEPL